MKYVLSFDLSLNNTGYTVFTDDGIFITTGSIDTHFEKVTQKKLHLIGKELLKLRKKYRPVVVVLEDAFSRFNKSTQQIYRVHGLVNYLFWGTEQAYYAPSSVRKIVCGKGNLNKEQVHDFLCARYPKVKFENYDQSDSFAVGLAYLIEKGILHGQVS